MLDLIERLEFAEERLTSGPWSVWTSCSFRRVAGPDGKDGGVLHAYAQRGDGHPDLSMPEWELLALVDLRNALPEVIALLRAIQTKESGHG